MTTLIGYVVGITYQGSEWLLTKDGRWSSNWPDALTGLCYVWPTEAQAQKLADKVNSDEYPTWIRPYHESPDRKS